jgi:DNA (cytosine-5)-methyltransferase 1
MMDSRPVVIDFCCRAGGAAMGYLRAGFRVVGVDVEDCADRYPGEFIQDDVTRMNLISLVSAYRAVLLHWSPPCQGQIAMVAGNRAREGYWGDDHVNLIPGARRASQNIGLPYVIENGPSRHIRPDVTLCGLRFGLRTFRHRAFEFDGFALVARNLLLDKITDGIHVSGSHRDRLTAGWRHGCLRTWPDDKRICPLHNQWCEASVYGVYGSGGGKPNVVEAQRALGIQWMTNTKDLNEAIPPAYTELVGTALMGVLL